MKNIIKYVLCLSLVACIVVFSCLSASAVSTGHGEEGFPEWDRYIPVNSVFSRYHDADTDEWSIVSVGLGEPTYDDMSLIGFAQVNGNVIDYSVYSDILDNDVLALSYTAYEETLRLYTTAIGYDFIDVPCLLRDVVTGFGVKNYCEYGDGGRPVDAIVSANIECYLTGPDGFIPCQMFFDVSYFNDGYGLPEFSPFFGTFPGTSGADYAGASGDVEVVFDVDGELVEFIVSADDEGAGIANLLADVREYITSGPISDNYNLDLAYNQPCLIRDMSVEYSADIFQANYTIEVYEDDVGYSVELPEVTVQQVQVNVFDWLLQGIAGVLGTPLFGENSMTLGSLLLIAITLPLVFGVLKIFAGG